MDLGRRPVPRGVGPPALARGAVSQGAIPDTVAPPRAPAGGHARPPHRGGRAAHPDGRRGRGGRDRPRRQVDLPRSGAARLLPDPRPEPARAGRQAVLPRLEEALIRTLAAFGVRRRGSTGSPASGSTPAAAEDRVDRRPHLRWVTTHGYALNVDLDPAPFTEWITACGLEDAAFTTMARELGRPVTVDEVRPPALEALAEVFELAFEELPAEEGTALAAARARAARCRASGVPASTSRRRRPGRARTPRSRARPTSADRQTVGPPRVANARYVVRRRSPCDMQTAARTARSPRRAPT